LSRNDLAKDKRLRCNPPLRDPAEVEALWGSLRRGDINMIGSDHAPLPKDMEKNIWEIFGGLGDVVEVMVAVLFSEAVYNRNIGLENLVDLCCSTPARVFGLYPRKGAIAPGSDADLVVLEVGGKKTLVASDLQMLGDTWSAYEGWTIRVSPEITILRGKVIIDKGEVCGSPGQGEFVNPRA
jgi:dihydroorotase-like cyclic amidohydrolase